MFRSLFIALSLMSTTQARQVQIEGLLDNLRENWESPMAYLETRGYLKGNNGTTSNETFVETAMNATKLFLGKLKQTWTGWLNRPSNITSKSTRGIYLNLTKADLEAMKQNIEKDKKLIHCMLESLKNMKTINSSSQHDGNATEPPVLLETTTAMNGPCANETGVFVTFDSPNDAPSKAHKNSTDSKYITRKLEYLAHLHHPVESVGIKKDAVNLRKIQALIDRIKYSPDNGVYDSTPSIQPPFGENYLTRSRRTAKSFTEKLNEISRHLNRSLNKGKELENVEIEASDGPPKEADVDVEDLTLMHLSDEQTAEIERFQNDLNSPPQQFNFDIQPYLEVSANKLGPEAETELVTARTYFEFGDDSQKQDDKRALKPSTPYVTFNVPAMHQKPLQSDLSDYNRDANEFVDRYYLLNDGQTNVGEIMPEDENILKPSNFNMEDLNIDLKLNKEFRELEDETGHRQRPRDNDQFHV